MKNKKLFAILTLVCFMFTLMPMAAFAATDMQVYVNGAAEAEVTAGVPFEVTTTDSAVYFVEDEDGEGVAVSVDGKFSGIKVAGDYKVYALASTRTDAIAEYVLSVASPAEKVETLKAAYADEIDKFDYAELTIVSPDLEYRITFEDVDGKALTNLSIAANNGFNAGDKDNVVAVLEKSPKGANKWSALKGQTITLTTVGYADAEFVDGAVTDKNGEAEFEVTSGTAGEYKVIAKWNKTKATLNVKVVAGSATKVVVNAEPAAPVNIDNETVQKAGVEFKFTDANGAAAAYEAVEITLVEKPETSKLKSENFKLVPDNKGKAGVYDLDGEKVFDKEGTYKVKVALENGASATAAVEVAKMGDVVAIKFVEAPTTVAYDAVGTEEAPLTLIGDGVVGVDADGVIGAIEGVEYSYVGKAVKSFEEDGTLVLKNDEDYIGTIVTVYAVYETAAGEVFTTSNEVVVTDAAASVVYTSTTAEVGVTTTLAAKLVDANGNKVTANGATVKYIVLEKPENAIAVVTGNYNVDGKGLVYTKLLASAAGEYEIQTIVVTDDNKYIASVDTFTVGAKDGAFKDVVVVSINADTIIVNDTVKAIPAAAVIKDSRTFVPFRALAEAFGAVVDYDQATGAVTAELNGVKVVMMNGEKAYTVNGVAKVADVAPYLNVEASTTMVPVSFVASAFGINYQCIYAEDGTVADVLFTK